MTAIADASVRTYTAPRIHNFSLYPFMVLFAYLPFLLYMHRSKIDPRGLDVNSLRDHLAYYHADLTLYVLVACILWLAKPLRQWSLLILTALYYLATSDWFSWHTQSKPFFFSDLYRAAQLLIYYPEFVTELPGGFKARATILLGFPILVIALFRSQWFINLTNTLRPPITLLSGALIAGVLILAPWLVSASYAHKNSIVHMISEQLYDRKLEGIAADRDTMKSLFGHDNTQPSLANNHTEAAPTGDNVIIFIIETAPFTLYPKLDELAAGLDHPWLKDNSVTFNRHYGTYPASDRASYSILSGLYPPMLHHNDWKDSMQYGDSLPKALATHGYTSYLFSTAPLAFYGDDVMYQNLGFTQLWEVERTKSLRVKTEDGYRWDREQLYDMDEELIQMTIKTLSEHASNEYSGPFMATIAPQSSHAPLNCPPDYRSHPDACQSEAAKLRANTEWQFGLLGRLIKDLDASGLLDKTLLIITGDHGIRSKHESTSFMNANFLQQSTFHVPLMVASSRLGQTAFSFQHPTSHVDIAPTVLDLLGLNRNNSYFHGRNLFNASPRTVYFIGTGYFPASGFLQNDRYYMENRSNGLRLSAPTMDFNDRSQTSSDEQIQQTAQDELLKLEAFLRREYQPITVPH